MNPNTCWKPYNEYRYLHYYDTKTFKAGEFLEYWHAENLEVGFDRSDKVKTHPPRIRVPTFVKYYLIIPHIRKLYILILYKC